MPAVKKQAIMPYSAAQMYALVDDIPAYPEFLSWCVAAEEHTRTADEVRATLTLAASGLQRAFTTVNRLRPGQMIELRLVDGPFKQLEGFWRFEDLSAAGTEVAESLVSLDLEYEFNSKLLQLTFGPLFNQVANSLVNCFCERARALYSREA